MDFLDRAVAGTFVPEVRPRPSSFFDSWAAGPEPEWDRAEEIERDAPAPAAATDGEARSGGAARRDSVAGEPAGDIGSRKAVAGEPAGDIGSRKAVAGGPAGDIGSREAPAPRASRGPAARAGEAIPAKRGGSSRRDTGLEDEVTPAQRALREEIGGVEEEGVGRETATRTTADRAIGAVPGTSDRTSHDVPRGGPSGDPLRPPAGTAGKARASARRDRRPPDGNTTDYVESVEVGRDEWQGAEQAARHDAAGIAFPAEARLRPDHGRRRAATAAEPARAEGGLPGVPAQETVVHVSIGRIEVRAERPAKPAPAARPRPPAPAALDEYLRRRDEARR